MRLFLRWVVALALVVVGRAVDDREERINNFVRWVTENGADMSSLEIFPSPEGGYGTRATRAIVKGEVFVSVPPILSLNERSALRNPQLGPIIRSLYATNESQWNEFASLVLHMMHEACYVADSFYTPYLRLLPLEFPGHKSTFTESDFALVRQVATLNQIMGTQYPGESNFQFFMNSIFARHPEIFGADTPAMRSRWRAELEWAFAVVGTRCYGPRFEGDVSTMIPILDMLNHQNHGSLSSFIAHADVPDTATPEQRIAGYAKTATMSYAVGDEVWASYTGMVNVNCCQQKLFNSWGFTLEEPHSQCLILSVMWTPPTVSSPHGEALKQKLRDVDLFPKPDSGLALYHPIRADDPTLPSRLLQFFRITQTEGEEFLRVAASTDFSAPVSADSELRVVRSLRGFLLNLQSEVQREHQQVMAAVGQPSSASNTGSPALSAAPVPYTPVVRSIVNVVNGQVAAAEHALKLVDQHWLSLIH